MNAIFAGNEDVFRQEEVFWLKICMWSDVGIEAISEKKIQEAAAIKFSRVLFESENRYFEEFKRKTAVRRRLVGPRFLAARDPLEHGH